MKCVDSSNPPNIYVPGTVLVPGISGQQPRARGGWGDRQHRSTNKRAFLQEDGAGATRAAPGRSIAGVGFLPSVRSGQAQRRPAPAARRNALSDACLPSTRFCSPRSRFRTAPGPPGAARASPGLRGLLPCLTHPLPERRPGGRREGLTGGSELTCVGGDAGCQQVPFQQPHQGLARECNVV